jgi:hypothetical protein
MMPDSTDTEMRDAASASLASQEAVAAVTRDAARYRAFKVLVYDRKDASLDAYDPEGLDAELDRRIAEEPALAGGAP